MNTVEQAVDRSDCVESRLALRAAQRAAWRAAWLRAGWPALCLAILLALAGPVAAQISFVSFSSTADPGAVRNVAVARPAGLASGDVMLAFVSTRGGGQFPASISAPAGWTLVLTRDNGSSIGVAVFSKAATATEPASYSFSVANRDRTAAAISAFRGADISSPVNASAAEAYTPASNYTAPGVTTTTANTMLVALYAADNGNGSISTVAGMALGFVAGTRAGGNGVAIGSSHALQAAAGASGNKVSSGNSSLAHIGALVALRAGLPSALAVWRMDESAWAGNPAEVLDSSGNRHHGTAKRAAGSTPVPTASAGRPAYTVGAQSTCHAGQFDTRSGTVRTNGYVELPTLPDLVRSFTVTAWLQSDDVGITGQRVLVRDDADNGWGISLGDGGSGRLRLFNRTITNNGTVVGDGVDPACGVFCLETKAVLTSASWFFMGAIVDTTAQSVQLLVYDQAGRLLANTSTSYSGTWRTGSGMSAIGGETDASAEGRISTVHFQGRIDEVQIYPEALTPGRVASLLPTVRTCPVYGPDHYELSVPTSSLACMASTVTVTACADNTSPCTNPATTLAGQTASLATSAGTLGSSTVTFNAAGMATTTLSHAGAADGAGVNVTLSGEQTSAANPRQCCTNGTTCTVANSCSTTFNTAGFIVSATASGTAATVPTQVAGTTSSGYFLRAVRTNTSTNACQAAITGARNVNWSVTCNNPSTCSAGRLMTVTGSASVAVAGNPNGSTASRTAVAMLFDTNGNAPFSFSYADVGQVTLSAYMPASGTLLTALSGASNAFVVRPGGFALTNIRQTAAPQLANPAAANASGARFIRAGESFSATVTARTSGGATTPNYGRENLPEGVLLTRALVLPFGGAAGTLTNATVAGGSFTAGVATVTNLAYDEVGIITLTPSVADGNYLGTGNWTGTATANIGRFFPARFALSAGSITHRAALSCSPDSSFSYLGENFRLGLTLTAQNTAGATTTNYTGAFAKLDPATADWNPAGRDATSVFTVASTRLSLGSATGSFSNGVASGVTLTANATRAAAPDGPFNAVFGVAPVDSDGVAITAFNTASTPSGGNDRAAVATVALRFGRLRLGSAAGAADRALALPVLAQHWTGSAFDTNTLDSCTAVAVTTINFGNLRGTLGTADTAASGGIALVNGVGQLRLAAPGGGRSGTYDVALSLGSSSTDASCLQPWAPGAGDAATSGANLAYLRGNFCAGTFGNDPAARATFGRQRGVDSLVYRRENF